MRIASATVHLVDHDVDSSPIVLHGAVPAYPTDTVADLQQRILSVERRLYPLTPRSAAEMRLRFRDGRLPIHRPEDEACHMARTTRS